MRVSSEWHEAHSAGMDARAGRPRKLPPWAAPWSIALSLPPWHDTHVTSSRAWRLCSYWTRSAGWHTPQRPPKPVAAGVAPAAGSAVARAALGAGDAGGAAA